MQKQITDINVKNWWLKKYTSYEKTINSPLWKKVMCPYIKDKSWKKDGKQKMSYNVHFTMPSCFKSQQEILYSARCWNMTVPTCICTYRICTCEKPPCCSVIWEHDHWGVLGFNSHLKLSSTLLINWIAQFTTHL